MSNPIDKCDPIRNKLKQNNVDPSKYNLCYTKSLSIHNEPSCSLCRHDPNSKTFICRPNENDEETFSVKQFCGPMTTVNPSQLNDIYYNNVIDTCKLYKNSKSGSKSRSKSKSSSKSGSKSSSKSGSKSSSKSSSK